MDEIYCVCKGMNPSGFFVACEAECDCPYGGWLHPECTQDLVNLPREIIDNMGVWYCAACTERMRLEEHSDNDSKEDHQDDQEMKSDSDDSEEVRRLEAEVEEGKLRIQDLEKDFEEGEAEEIEDQISPLTSRKNSVSEESRF